MPRSRLVCVVHGGIVRCDFVAAATFTSRNAAIHATVPCTCLSFCFYADAMAAARRPSSG
eukprot:3388383-Pleurochrysis_carterae.AAC.3